MEKSYKTAASSKIATPQTTEDGAIDKKVKPDKPRRPQKERMKLSQIVTIVIVLLLVLSFMGSYFFMYGIPALMGIAV